ncbi:hypothetical protein SLE2022_148470 [Rubroshorea leprosula]
MAPIYLNKTTSSFFPPHDQNPHDHNLHLSVPTFSNPNQDQRFHDDDNKGSENYMTREGSSIDHGQACLPSSSVQSAVDHKLSSFRSTHHEISSSNNWNRSAGKWMSSKTRLMHRMINSNSPGTDKNNDINTTIRVCSACNTTSTPLWRTGPRGPKSLCNACGIRQRKARRAMEAAAASDGVADSVAARRVKVKAHAGKEKKSRKRHVDEHKIQKYYFKAVDSGLQDVFPLPHDVEDAAILLMELSCGLLNSHS